ncbi:hypothetical protein GCM10010441_42950 [Kitasatospora paracochleata]
MTDGETPSAEPFVLERALAPEATEHPGYERGDPVDVPPWPGRARLRHALGMGGYRRRLIVHERERQCWSLVLGDGTRL